MERSATLLSDSEKGNSPLTVEQYRVWFLSQMERNSTQFNINLAYKIFGDLDYTILESSLNLIVERHDTLRTVFRSNGNEPEQVVMEDLWIPINIIKPNIVEIEDQAIELQALELLEKEIEKPFSLENGPLINLTIYELNSNERLLLFKIHHIIADFQSLETLIKELGYNYNLKLKGEEYNLPA
ncbi:condensation domain-containing protein [Alkalihalobacillus hemicellulosilyticus]|uniref:Non-ribosomal peptide synthetase n=1 Tax=Halalkalibacter hemicellulosilyticusJCM 9152 TaxID=1236971 RepID=W4QKI0_9BACI|nr:condensation domain-containing protein [Halalkalibacter hemicellulosilyticus]GAE32625.1 non-ribosomal peptide synthetase [Halalkalibacter hemicellulosilyticusJCM 9152]